MKLDETTASARRVGPIKAVDGSFAPVTDFSPAGSVQKLVNGGAWSNVDASVAGVIVPILDTVGAPSGLVYYQGSAGDAGAEGGFTIKLSGVCLERAFTEWVEARPQGIPYGSTDADLLHAGPLEAKDADGNPVTGGVGIIVELSVNGAQLQVPLNALVELTGGSTDGYYDLPLDPSELPSGAAGWTMVRIYGACQEFVMRVDVVDPANLTAIGSAGPSFPTPPTVPATLERAARGDLALTWSNELGSADISRTQYDDDLTTDEGLTTAVLLSLLTDRRAQADDKPPSGDPTDRRGWWADEFAEVAGDLMGSRLWLLDRSTLSNETVLRAREYVLEALAWMLEDRVVSGINAKVERMKGGLLIGVELQQPGKDPVSYRFAHTWENQQEAA